MAYGPGMGSATGTVDGRTKKKSGGGGSTLGAIGNVAGSVASAVKQGGRSSGYIPPRSSSSAGYVAPQAAQVAARRQQAKVALSYAREYHRKRVRQVREGITGVDRNTPTVTSPDQARRIGQALKEAPGVKETARDFLHDPIIKRTNRKGLVVNKEGMKRVVKYRNQEARARQAGTPVATEKKPGLIPMYDPDEANRVVVESKGGERKVVGVKSLQRKIGTRTAGTDVVAAVTGVDPLDQSGFTRENVANTAIMLAPFGAGRIWRAGQVASGAIRGGIRGVASRATAGRVAATAASRPALISRGVQNLARFAAPQTAARAAALGARAPKPVKALGTAMSTKPIRTTLKAGGVAAVAAGTARDPAGTVESLGELRDSARQITPNDLKTAGDILLHSPEAVYHSLEDFATDKQARDTTLQAFPQVAISTILFPFVAAKEIADKGPIEGAASIGSMAIEGGRERWEAILNNDWTRLTELHREAEQGGVLFTLTEAAPLAAGLSKAGGLVARDAARLGSALRIPGAEAQRIKFETRPDLRVTLGPMGTKHQRVAKGLIGRNLQMILDASREAKYNRKQAKAGKPKGRETNATHEGHPIFAKEAAFDVDAGIHGEVVPLFNVARRRGGSRKAARAVDQEQLMATLQDTEIYGRGRMRRLGEVLRGVDKETVRGLSHYAQRLKPVDWVGAQYMARTGARTQSQLRGALDRIRAGMEEEYGHDLARAEEGLTLTRERLAETPDDVQLQDIARKQELYLRALQDHPPPEIAEINTVLSGLANAKWDKMTAAAEALGRAGQEAAVRSPHIDASTVGEGGLTSAEINPYAEVAEWAQRSDTEGRLGTPEEELGPTPAAQTSQAVAERQTVLRKAEGQEANAVIEADRASAPRIKLAQKGVDQAKRKVDVASRRVERTAEREVTAAGDRARKLAEREARVELREATAELVKAERLETKAHESLKKIEREIAARGKKGVEPIDPPVWAKKKAGQYSATVNGVEYVITQKTGMSMRSGSRSTGHSKGWTVARIENGKPKFAGVPDQPTLTKAKAAVEQRTKPGPIPPTKRQAEALGKRQAAWEAAETNRANAKMEVQRVERSIPARGERAAIDARKRERANPSERVRELQKVERRWQRRVDNAVRNHVREHTYAKQRREIAAQRARQRRQEAQAAYSEARGRHERTMADEGGRADIFNRNWKDDRNAYVRTVGPDRIREAAGTSADPAYVPDVIPQGRKLEHAYTGGLSKDPPKASTGSLARKGRRATDADTIIRAFKGNAEATKKVRTIFRVAEELGMSLPDVFGQFDVPYPKGKTTRAEAVKHIINELNERIPEGQYALVNAGRMTAQLKKYVKDNPTATAHEIQNHINTLLRPEAKPKTGKAEYSTPVMEELADLLMTHEQNPNFWKDLEGWRLVEYNIAEQVTPRPSDRASVRATVDFLTNSKALASRLLLGLNPQWLGFQVVANAALLGVAEPRAFFGAPYTAWMDRRLLGREPEAWRNFEEQMGISPHMQDYGNAPGKTAASWLVYKAGLENSRAFMTVRGRSILDPMFALDYKNNRAFRSIFLADKVKRAAWDRMDGRMARIEVLMDRITHGITGGKVERPRLAEYQRRFVEVAKDRKLMDQLGREVDEWMGDYLSFTSSERALLSNNVMFYGFLRHSLSLALLTVPRSPVKAAILTKMGQISLDYQRETLHRLMRQALKGYIMQQARLSHTNPTDEQITQWVNHYDRVMGGELDWIPLPYLGDFIFKGPVELPLLGEVVPEGWASIGTSRASALGNVLLEGDVFADGNLWRLTGLLNPFLVTAVEGITGFDTFTGQPFRVRGQSAAPFGLNSLDLANFSRHIIEDLGNLIPPLRGYSKGMAEYPTSKRSHGAFPPFVDEIPTEYGTAVSKADAKRAIKDFKELQGTPLQEVLRTTAPFAPKPLDPRSVLYSILGPDVEGEGSKLDELGQDIRGWEPFGEADYPWDNAKQANPFGDDSKNVFDKKTNFFDEDRALGGPNVPNASRKRSEVGAVAKGVAGLVRVGSDALVPEGKSNVFGSVKSKQQPAKAEDKKKPKPIQITGPLTEAQKTFGETLAHETGLSPRVIGAWMLAENSDQNAIDKEADGYHNWLNIGPFDDDSRFGDPVTAAKATAAFLAGKDNAPAGGAGGDIPATILPAAGLSDEEQMRAIESSDWSATGYGAGATLDGTYALVDAKGKGAPKADSGELLQTSELFYDPGTNLKDGQPTSAIGGHTDHVHFASEDPISMLRVAKKAQELGMLPEGVGENPAFDVIDSEHSAEGYHYREMEMPSGKQGKRLIRKTGAEGPIIGQALDIAGDAEQMAKLNEWIADHSGVPTATSDSAAVYSGGGATSSGGTSSGGSLIPGMDSAGLPKGGGGGKSQQKILEQTRQMLAQTGPLGIPIGDPGSYATGVYEDGSEAPAGASVLPTILAEYEKLRLASLKRR